MQQDVRQECEDLPRERHTTFHYRASKQKAALPTTVLHTMHTTLSCSAAHAIK